MKGLLPPPLMEAAERVLQHCIAHAVTLAVAESCTGGLVCAALTAIAGSSAVVERGFVTYANAAKIEQLGVFPALLELHGAVSPEVARAMAEGALAHSTATASLAITGIAGPGGGTLAKPVGTVHIAASRLGGTTMHRALLLAGDRDDVRLAAAVAGLELLLGVVDGVCIEVSTISAVAR
jgi:nicotinamide-nucleotide amidase